MYSVGIQLLMLYAFCEIGMGNISTRISQISAQDHYLVFSRLLLAKNSEEILDFRIRILRITFVTYCQHMNSQILFKMLAKYGTDQFEAALIFKFIETHKLDPTKSDFINRYLSSAEVNSELKRQVQDFKISSLKELENCLELIMPKKDRKLNGAFFTPNYIVDYIINEVKPQITDKIVDPSCGSGAFLIGILEYFHKILRKDVKLTIEENIFGADILPYNSRRTKLLLSLYGLMAGCDLGDVNFNIRNVDSLKVDWAELFPSNDTKFDSVIGNPPYVKFQDLPDELRSSLPTKWRTIAKGNFNLYFAFFELGYDLLIEGGTLGYITPNNYFTSLAGEPLRKFFVLEKCVSKIVDFNSSKVFRVQTYTAITFLKKEIRKEIMFDRIVNGQQPEDFLKNLNFSSNSYRGLNVKKWRILKESEQENIRILENVGTPIGQRFNIRVGIATLKDGLYFIDGNQSTGEFFLKVFEGTEYQIEKEITLPIYKISDFVSQEECNSNKRRIIFPYIRSSQKASVILPEKLKKAFPKCYEYFEAIRSKLTERGKGKASKEQKVWYEYGRSQSLNYTGEKLLTPTFSRRPRFLITQDPLALFCNGYALFCKSIRGFGNLLSNGSSDLINSPQNIDVVQKILNSELMHYYVSVTSVSIEGNYPCYQKNFIERFNIPDFDQNEIDELRGLKDKREIDEFLVRKYGVKFDSQLKSALVDVH